MKFWILLGIFKVLVDSSLHDIKELAATLKYWQFIIGHAANQKLVQGLLSFHCIHVIGVKDLASISTGCQQNNIRTSGMFIDPLCDIIHLAMNCDPGTLSGVVLSDFLPSIGL